METSLSASFHVMLEIPESVQRCSRMISNCEELVWQFAVTLSRLASSEAIIEVDKGRIGRSAFRAPFASPTQAFATTGRGELAAFKSMRLLVRCFRVSEKSS